MDFLKYNEIPAANSGEKGTLYCLDLPALLDEFKNDSVLQYDFMRFTACLQGLLNRENPTLFVDYVEDTDRFWFNYLRQPEKQLFGFQCRPIATVDDFFQTFSTQICSCGLLVWDAAVYATANVAVSVCSVEGYLPVRGSSPILRLVQEKTGASVRMDLTGKFTGTGVIPDTKRPSSGSKKCDAYLWAMELYLDRLSDCLLANIPDAMPWDLDKEPAFPDLQNTAMMNLDYYTSKKVFLFDLSPWGDEVPNDDPEQPLGCDKATFLELLQRMYDRSGGQKIISVSGFVPWHLKYTTYKKNGRHHEVESEWQYVELLSAYNCILDADGIGFISLPNTSIYCRCTIQEKLKNNRPAEIAAYDPDKIYVLMYMGDYDSAVWTSRFSPKFWNDPAHGSVPLAWPFNPNLSDRVPMTFEYVYHYKTANDYFVGGDSGAGYLNPTLLCEPRKHSDNPSGMQVWIEHCLKYYQKLDLDITGFLLNGALPITEDVLKAYAEISPAGNGIHHYKPEEITMYQDVPFVTAETLIAGQDGDPEGTLDRTLQLIQDANGRKFFILRSVLCSPGFMKNLVEGMKERNPAIEVVDPYTFFHHVCTAHLKDGK